MKKCKFVFIALILMFGTAFLYSKKNVDTVVCQSIDKPFEYLKPEFPDNNVVAHRGGSKENGFPDNSIAALKNTISLGCFASECDIHVTKDSQVVVFHGNTFEDLVFKDVTYREILAAGNLANGEKIPLLEEYLDVVLNARTTILFIDVKSKEDIYGGEKWSILAGQKAAEIIHKKKAKNFVKFIVSRENVMKECIKASRGDWECGYMKKDATINEFIEERYTWANFRMSAFYEKPEVIQTYKDKGIKVSIYNADTDAQMTWFLSQNMYAICTNYPSKLLGLIRGKQSEKHEFDKKKL